MRLAAFTAWVVIAGFAAGVLRAQTEGEQIFRKQIAPLLAQKCQSCHGAAKISGLSVANRESLLHGGRRGPALAPGDPAKSLLLTALEQRGDLKMPPAGTLAEPEIAAVRRWIDLGAPWPGGDGAPAAEGAPTDAATWAFRPPLRVSPPRAAPNPIDAFINEKLEWKRLSPAPRADRRTLIRRATFDLTGLPPTAAEVTDFLRDPAADVNAFRTLIDRLLASPRYGERWGRHWLDVVRYADTGGYSNDFERPNAWRYRDYVIRAFNQDKPYDQFIREQIAGDELDPSNPEFLVATGFLRMGPWEHTAMSVAAETRQLWLDDVTHSTGATFLGLTLECARCHDHKFDPLPTRDYYSLQAIFATTQFADRPAPFLAAEQHPGFESGRAELEELLRRNRAHLAEFDRLITERLAAQRGVAVADLPKQELAAALKKRDLITPEEFERFKVFQKREELYTRSAKRYSPLAYSVSYADTAPDIFILPVGNLKTPGAKVTPAVLTAPAKYGNMPAPELAPASIRRRLALANWIADRRNPLTARVMANRIWQYHFGTGIAANPNNLGKMGKLPTHPELLDYLATYFLDHGWSIKAMHRLIMTSDVYQRAAAPAQAADPGNELLAAFPARRLEAEELRDTILAVAGELSSSAGGPGTFAEINRDVATQPQQIMGTVMPAYRPSPTRDARHRRTIYTFQKRNLVDPLLEVFNGPSLDGSTEKRIATTIPTQVYALFNSEFVHDMALAFANRIAASNDGPDSRITAAFQAAFHRAPTPAERRLAAEHLAKLTARYRTQPRPAKAEHKPVVRAITSELTGNEVRITEDSDPTQYEENLQPGDVPPQTRALASLALALFNSNEFAYVY